MRRSRAHAMRFCLGVTWGEEERGDRVVRVEASNNGSLHMSPTASGTAITLATPVSLPLRGARVPLLAAAQRMGTRILSTAFTVFGQTLAGHASPAARRVELSPLLAAGGSPVRPDAPVDPAAQTQDDGAWGMSYDDDGGDDNREHSSRHGGLLQQLQPDNAEAVPTRRRQRHRSLRIISTRRDDVNGAYKGSRDRRGRTTPSATRRPEEGTEEVDAETAALIAQFQRANRRGRSLI